MKCLSWLWYALVVGIAFYMFVLVVGFLGVLCGDTTNDATQVLKWTIVQIAEIVG